MDARQVNGKLRRGEVPDADELTWFARGLADESVSDAQAGAFAMGVCRTGLDAAGRTALTQAMRDSGQVLRWDLPGPVVDKHSTGGVGDCVSLILAPALAACGAFVPMISGRGLGHTGGTLDKMEAIPGLETGLDEARLRALVAETGAAIVSASADIAPADKRLYLIRDVTGTVESLDLITASILSKKLAAGLEGLVLDVKTGSGAFMKTEAEARALAEALVSTAVAAGCRTSALITDMSQPLAPALGNALEVAACMRLMTDGVRGPLFELTCALGGALLAQFGLAEDDAAGAARIGEAIASGAAAERFGRMVAGMGGPARFVEDWARVLPVAPVVREVGAPRAGYVARMAAEALGLAVVDLGGGRHREGDTIDPAVGLSDVVRLGARVDVGQPLLRIHAASDAQAEAAAAQVRAAIVIEDGPPDVPPLVRGRIG